MATTEQLRSADMLGTLPKLLGRGFVLGFLLPSVLFSLYLESLTIDIPIFSQIGPELDAFKLAPIAFLAIMVAVVLMAINRMIVRMLEGYGRLNPLRLLRNRELARFRRDAKPFFDEYARLKEERKSNPDATSPMEGFALGLSAAATAFPLVEKEVLPTKFGNVMRSFERYPLILYGLDAIPAWPRLFLILPKPVKDQIRDGRALLDFSANLLVVSVIGALSAIAHIVLAPHRSYDYFALGIAVAAIVYGWTTLTQGAQQWGDLVKSVFDLHRHRLAKELGLAIPRCTKAERAMWRQASLMMLFRSPEAVDALESFRIPAKAVGPKRSAAASAPVAAPTGDAGADVAKPAQEGVGDAPGQRAPETPRRQRPGKSSAGGAPK